MISRRLWRTEAAFSLIELMVVVAIIGIISALAVPRYQAFAVRSKAAEVRTTLNVIFVLETAYHGANDRYGELGDVGFSINGVSAQTGATTLGPLPLSKIRYRYETSSVGSTVWLGTGTALAGVLGGCQTGPHVVMINQDEAIGPLVTETDTMKAPTPVPGC
jgi:prepilin-type N-terminal cleavage/methylation domain-containing protein